MKILVFGGTTEGRQVSGLLARAGASVTVCVATEYGAEEQGMLPGVKVHCGRLDKEQMIPFIEYADLVVDATHPYAVVVTRTVHQVCHDLGVPYRRLLRKEGAFDDGAVCVPDAGAAARWLGSTEGKILLTTGSKELRQYRSIDPERLVPRVLPTASGLSACEELRIPHRNIIAMQGPFSRELNEALIRQMDIRFLVTKNSGKAGGFEEKIQACADCGITPVVIMRKDEPVEPAERCTMEQLADWYKRRGKRAGKG